MIRLDGIAVDGKIEHDQVWISRQDAFNRIPVQESLYDVQPCGPEMLDVRAKVVTVVEDENARGGRMLGSIGHCSLGCPVGNDAARVTRSGFWEG